MTRSRGQLAVVVLVLAMILASLLLSGCTRPEKPSDPITVVYFQKDGCPDCLHMKESLAGLLAEHPELLVVYYDVDIIEDWQLMLRLARDYNETFDFGVVLPVIFVGETAIVGEGRPQELELQAAVEACSTGDCPSPLDHLALSLLLRRTSYSYALGAPGQADCGGAP